MLLKFMKNNNDKIRCEHILEEILKIEKCLLGVSFKKFESDFRIHYVVAKALENIGEAL
jgi:uncharacterized protein with HEPN domain